MLRKLSRSRVSRRKEEKIWRDGDSSLTLPTVWAQKFYREHIRQDRIESPVRDQGMVLGSQTPPGQALCRKGNKDQRKRGEGREGKNGSIQRKAADQGTMQSGE